jgi:anti-sigma regulatory factor (Ser/Thr protein kinase)
VQTLKDWGLLELIDTAELLVSELISNAVTAAGIAGEDPTHSALQGLETVVLQLQLVQGLLQILVWDGDPRPPILRDADPMSEGGRGLRLVAALSKRWGYYWAERGKVVWAELPPSGS